MSVQHHTPDSDHSSMNDPSFARPVQSLDVIEQLSIHIFSEVSHLYPEIGAAIVRTDRECTTPFWEELDTIIRNRLREIRVGELEHLIKQEVAL